MSNAPPVAIGLPLYNTTEHLPEALESLASQTHADFRLVMTDDSTNDEVERLARHFVTTDHRFSYERNDRRLGLTRNWRRAFERATAQVRGAEFFAWASDHDVWHPRWLEVLLRESRRRPDAACVYPRAAVLRAGRELSVRPPSIDTTDLVRHGDLVSSMARRTRAGYMIYGLFRADAVRGAGKFRQVLYADRLLLTEVALRGAIVEVPEILWYKRPTGVFSVERQRQACFPGRVPVSARLPWWTVHAGVLTAQLGLRGTAQPAIRRRSAVPFGARYAWHNGRVALASARRRRASGG